ncbi:ABC transporter substrate-binding protein [Streptomyces sp. NPDC102360]|uniref:ABC transporter substrate-binding protein n=1 Tax=Streptomyces sp. NPDC102360 TaxID=3366160 RepID=UPI0038047810
MQPRGIANRLLALTATLCALAGLTACSGDNGQVTLKVWSWTPNTEAAVAQWNRTHFDVRVELESLPPDPTTVYQKIFASVRTGSAPDVLPVEYMALPQFLSEGALADLSGLAGDQKSQYQPAAWSQVTAQGDPYALPGDISPLGLYFNRKVLKKYGYDKPPTTWEEFERMGLDIKKKSGGKVYLGALPTNANTFTGLSWQAGARWWNRHGETWKVDVDSAATRKVSATWQRMIDEGIVWLWNNDTVGQQKIRNNSLLTVVNPPWWATNLLSLGLPDKTWGVGDLPTWQGQRTSSAPSGGAGWGVSADSPHKREAVEFIKWMSQSAPAFKALSADSFYFPGSTAQTAVARRNRTTLTTPNGRGDVYTVFERSARRTATDWQWSPTSMQTLTSLTDSLTGAASGRALTSGLTRLQKTATSQLTSNGFKVRP